MSNRPDMRPLMAFLDKYTYKHEDPLPEGYSLKKEMDEKGPGCANCGDTINIVKLRTGGWLRAYVCNACGAFVKVYEQDRMGGAMTDPLEIYLP